MTEEEKIQFNIQLTSISLQLPTLTEMLKDHKEALRDGTQKMHSLEVAMGQLPCKEAEIRIRACEKHVEGGNTYRKTLIGTIIATAVTIVIVIIGFVQLWGTTLEKVNGLERVVYHNGRQLQKP